MIVGGIGVLYGNLYLAQETRGIGEAQTSIRFAAYLQIIICQLLLARVERGKGRHKCTTSDEPSC